MPLRDFLLGLLVIVIWSLNIIVIKVGVAELPPLLMTTLRFMLVAALLVPFYPVARAQLPFFDIAIHHVWQPSLCVVVHWARASRSRYRGRCSFKWARPLPPSWR